jgi:hypothetical protein
MGTSGEDDGAAWRIDSETLGYRNGPPSLDAATGRHLFEEARSRGTGVDVDFLLDDGITVHGHRALIAARCKGLQVCVRMKYHICAFVRLD